MFYDQEYVFHWKVKKNSLNKELFHFFHEK